MTRSQHDTVPESDGLAFTQLEVEVLPSLAEDLLAQWIRGKQPIAAGMPVGWIARVGWVVNDDYADGVCPFFAIHHTPIAASPPGAVARLAGRSQVVSIDVGGAPSGNSRLIPVNVLVSAGGAGWNL